MRARARPDEVGEETLLAMKKAMGLTGVWNRISRKARDAIKKDAQTANRWRSRSSLRRATPLKKSCLCPS